MDINTLFPSNFLKSSDLNGRQIIATIDRVESQTINDEDKAVLYFQGKEKGLVLNVTNKNMLIEICCGKETDRWHGTKVKLFSVKVDFQGRRVDGLRVDYAEQPPEPEPGPELTEDDIPF